MNATRDSVNLLSRREFLSRMVYTGAAAAGMSLAGALGPARRFATIAAPAPVTLRMLVVDIGVYVQGVRDVIEAFRQSQGGRYGHVTIQVETAPFAQLFPKIQAAVAAGASPDLLMVDGPLTKNYAFNKILTPIEAFLNRGDKDQWIAASVDEGSYKRVLYAAPMFQSAALMFYNRRMTDEAGIRPPQELDRAWTIDQAIDAWRRTTVDRDRDGRPEVWGFWASQGTSRNDYTHGLFRRMAGARDSRGFTGIAPDGVTLSGYLDSAESIRGLQIYQDLHQRHKVSPLEPIPNPFFSGRVAFVLAPDNYFGERDRLFPQGGFEMGVTPIPQVPGGAHMTHTGSWHLGISVQSERAEEAAAFVKFATGPEGSRILYRRAQQLPANKEVLNALPEYREYPKRLFREALERIGVPRIQTPGYEEYQTLIRQMLDEIARGSNVVNTTRSFAQRMDRVLEKYTGWNR